MKSLIKEIALEVGFDIISFSSPVSVLSNFKILKNYSLWLENRFNAEMKYLVNSGDKKFNPTLIENWVKSIILVGASYFNHSKIDRPSEEFGRVSMYAWGQDYHFVIKTMLSEMVSKLKSVLGKEFRYRVFSDAVPLYEKGFAFTSGLGFQGKNTCVINPKIGSFFFIGEIITDLELEPDVELQFKGCGKCTKCISSCPTNALDEYVLNSSKCISYLTIEYKGMIPEELAFKMGDWVFGCDICQEVCPFNKVLYVKKFLSRINKFSLNITPFLNLKDIMAIESNNKFKKVFSGKAFLRAGRKGMIRNAIIVAVNNNASKLKDIIYNLTNDKDEVISTTAKWALELI